MSVQISTFLRPSAAIEVGRPCRSIVGSIPHEVGPQVRVFLPERFPSLLARSFDEAVNTSCEFER